MPLLSAERFRRWNDEMAARFDPEAFHHHPNPLVRFVEAQRVRVIRRLLRLDPGQAVFEVGCGPGDLLLALPGRPRCGIDISRPLLRRARVRLGDGPPLLLGDAESLPLASGSLQRVLCSELLEHTQHPGRVLSEIARVLAPGGLAVVSVPEERLINSVKERLARVPLLGPRLLGAPAKEEAYAMVQRMDEEWHLHAFSLDLLAALLPPELSIERVASVPARLLPLRRVLALRKGDQ